MHDVEFQSIACIMQLLHMCEIEALHMYVTHAMKYTRPPFCSRGLGTRLRVTVPYLPHSASALAHLLAGELVGADALDERDGVRVELVGLVGHVHDGKGHPEAKPFEVAHLGGGREGGRDGGKGGGEGGRGREGGRESEGGRKSKEESKVVVSETTKQSTRLTSGGGLLVHA